MASLGGDTVSERELYMRLLRPLAVPDFANVLLEQPAPPESSTTSSAASSTRVVVNEPTGSLIPRCLYICVVTAGLLGNERTARYLTAGLKAHCYGVNGSIALIHLQGADWAELAEQVRQQAARFDIVVMMLQVNGCHEDGNYHG